MKRQMQNMEQQAWFDDRYGSGFSDYEVYCYAFTMLEDGSTQPADVTSPPGKIDGWCAYVRVNFPDGKTNVIEDQDFDNFSDAKAVALDWAKQYECDVEYY